MNGAYVPDFSLVIMLLLSQLCSTRHSASFAVTLCGDACHVTGHVTGHATGHVTGHVTCCRTWDSRTVTGSASSWCVSSSD